MTVCTPVVDGLVVETVISPLASTVNYNAVRPDTPAGALSAIEYDTVPQIKSVWDYAMSTAVLN